MSINKIYKLNKNLKAIGLALVIALFGGSIIALSSCDSNGGNSYNVDRLTAEERASIEQAGIFHNKALDAIISDFMQERIRLFHETANHSPELRSATATQPCFEQVVLNTIKRLMKEWGFVQDEREAQAFIAELPVLNHSGTRASFEQDVIRQLTPFQTKYYHRLMSIIERSDVMNQLDPLLSEIAALEMQIEQNAPTMEEAKPLLYVASVVRHAAKYWNENRKRWFTMLFSEIVEKVVFIEEEAAENTTTRGVGLLHWICPEIIIRSILGESFLLPHPHTPCSFIFLTNGNAYVKECPADLHWNVELETCDYPYRAGWWDRWGQCTVGTIGMAGLGGLGGATVTSPTVLGIPLGISLGVIFGGMVGLATFC